MLLSIRPKLHYSSIRLFLFSTFYNRKNSSQHKKVKKVLYVREVVVKIMRLLYFMVLRLATMLEKLSTKCNEKVHHQGIITD